MNNSLAAPDSKILSEGKWYVLLALGVLDEEEGGSSPKEGTPDVSMLEHQVVGVSGCPCDVLSCVELCDCLESGMSLRLLKLHGKRSSLFVKLVWLY